MVEFQNKIYGSAQEMIYGFNEIFYGEYMNLI